MRWWSRRTALLCAVLAAALLGAAYYALSRDDSLTRLQQAGAITIGYSVEPPYAFFDSGGEVTGESPDVARRIASRLGIGRIQWRQIEFDLLIPELESGRIDVIAAGMFITPERAHRVAFSRPTFHVQQALLVQKGNPLRLCSYDDAVQRPHLRVAVLSGSVELQLLRSAGANDDQLSIVPDALTGRVAVESGVAQALALSSPAIRWMAKREQLGETEAAEPFLQPPVDAKTRLGYGAFGFRKEDRRLLLSWNSALSDFLGTPEHQQLQENFGFTKAELPGKTTASAVLGE